ncbi:MAG TPA: VOC family protein [Anaerolineales bacterium]|nr:VOC family protein [Anaerolineales bacterium]
MSNHKFVHIELSSTDSEAMKKFYGTAFGWQFQDFPDMGNYTTFTTGEGEVGGGFKPVTEENPPGSVIIYIHTDDLADTKSRIQGEGGTILMDDLDIPTVGTMSIFKDLSGNVLALLQSVAM